MNTTAPAIVKLEKITKRFGPVVANNNISFDIHPGKIRALLGENGAGKSTLMSILAGRMQPDAGQIIIDAKKVRLAHTRDAISAGIGMVYQHFMLVEAMSVAENIFLGQEPSRRLDRKKMQQDVGRLAERYGLTIDPAAKVGTLSMGERQRVEILRLLHRNSRILIFDEPTAVLTPQECDSLFDAFRTMAQQGKAIVFISHKLNEVMAVADQIAILRLGQIIDDISAKDISDPSELALRMVGKKVLLNVDRPSVNIRQRVLHVSHVSDDKLNNITFSLRQGEVISLVGVAGNGQRRLVDILTGQHPPSRGRVTILGQAWAQYFKKPLSPMSFIPEDRLGQATCPNLDLVDNFMLTTTGFFSRGPFLIRKKAKVKLEELIDSFSIAAPSCQIAARYLSGGNLQKLVAAREFHRRPRLIIAEQPTQGLDIRATEEIWDLLLKARAKAGLLLITGDLAEAQALSDFIGVVYNGRIIDFFAGSDKQKWAQVGPMMAGMEPVPPAS